MNKLDRLIFDDLILLFFGYDPNAKTRFWNIARITDAFPENEITEKELFECGNELYYKSVNWIRRIR